MTKKTLLLVVKRKKRRYEKRKKNTRRKKKAKKKGKKGSNSSAPAASVSITSDDPKPKEYLDEIQLINNILDSFIKPISNISVSIKTQIINNIKKLPINLSINLSIDLMNIYKFIFNQGIGLSQQTINSIKYMMPSLTLEADKKYNYIDILIEYLNCLKNSNTQNIEKNGIINALNLLKSALVDEIIIKALYELDCLDFLMEFSNEDIKNLLEIKENNKLDDKICKIMKNGNGDEMIDLGDTGGKYFTINLLKEKYEIIRKFLTTPHTLSEIIDFYKENKIYLNYEQIFTQNSIFSIKDEVKLSNDNIYKFIESRISHIEDFITIAIHSLKEIFYMNVSSMDVDDLDWKILTNETITNYNIEDYKKKIIEFSDNGGMQRLKSQKLGNTI